LVRALLASEEIEFYLLTRQSPKCAGLCALSRQNGAKDDEEPDEADEEKGAEEGTGQLYKSEIRFM
jgi:hypothetical protein